MHGRFLARVIKHMKEYRVGFLMTQLLGHITHGQRIQTEAAQHPEIHPTWMPISPWSDDRWQKLPLVKNNLTLLYGLRARDHLNGHGESFDVLFCHTQEPAVLLGKYMNRIPTILSLDATPLNMDSLGQAYGHGVSAPAVERMKYFLVRKSFQRAAHLVTWSRWAKESLVKDYGIAEQRITVIPPGIDLAAWHISEPERAATQNDPKLRILFVGGDFQRKGGTVLLHCAVCRAPDIIVDIVTREDVANVAGAAHLTIHRNLKAGAPELLALYRNANMFVLPSLGETFGLSIMEAMAMRLPVVTTNIGAIPELVVDGETGILVPPNSPGALNDAIVRLRNDPGLRIRMGNAGRKRAEELFASALTYRKLMQLITSVADKATAVAGSSASLSSLDGSRRSA